MSDTPAVRRGSTFPIVEAFGYAHDSTSDAAQAARDERYCRFAESSCEKFRQYGYGYCSVTYTAEWDKGSGAHPYAVCDHRLDGSPVYWAVQDHFGDRGANLVPEVTATQKPKLNVDYVAFRDDVRAEGGVDMIAIETQAIDLRGGGVGPAWRAWMNGEPELWRSYFTQEAEEKGRRDTVAYGVNTGNVYKRLGTQVAAKGEYLYQIHVPLYVITQHRILEQLRKRVDFQLVHDSTPWDITFASFDYLGGVDADGSLNFGIVDVVRTTLVNYVEALTGSNDARGYLRSDFIAKVKKKRL